MSPCVHISGFFLGGGAPLRNDVTNTNKQHFFCRTSVVLESHRSSQGGVCVPCTLPLKSAPSYGKINNLPVLIIASLCLIFLAYDKVCLSDVLVKWKQEVADGDVVIFHKPLEALENPYLPFVGK